MYKRNLHILLLILLFAGISVTACIAENAPPQPASDSSQGYQHTDKGIPVDDKVYSIGGEVVGDVGSLVQQTEPGQGSIVGTGYGTYGSYFGPEYEGKGFVRLKVTTSDSPLAPVGAIVVLKVTDTKASVLLPGDRVFFKCRHQYEAVAAIRENETFEADKLETWEIDYCRLESPIISGQ